MLTGQVLLSDAMTSIDFKLPTNFPIPTASWDENASDYPCGCLPAPPDFDLPPPPLLSISGLSDSDLASMFATDPLLQSCPSTSFGNYFSGIDNSAPAVWTNDGEIDVIKSKDDDQQLSVTLMAAVAGAATLVLFVVAFLVAFYCRSKRTPSFFMTICLRRKKSLSVDRQHSGRYIATSAMPNTRRSRNKSHQGAKFACDGFHGDSGTENTCALSVRRTDEKGNGASAERPVGADWTYKGAKKTGNVCEIEAKTEHSIYDVPHALPNAPKIIVTFPDTVSQSTSGQLGRSPPPRISLPVPPQASTYHHSHYLTSYDNHNPVYEEISLHNEPLDCAQNCEYGLHLAVDSGASTSSANSNNPARNCGQKLCSVQCAHGDNLRYGTVNQPCRCGSGNVQQPKEIYACAENNSGRESGYCTEGCPQNHNYVAYCRACSNNPLKKENRKSKNQHDFQKMNQSRSHTLNNNVDSVVKEPKNVGRKLKTMISPKRQKQYYTNGSLAMSLADGFEINVQQSAYV